jgi:hypothetical protein
VSEQSEILQTSIWSSLTSNRAFVSKKLYPVLSCQKNLSEVPLIESNICCHIEQNLHKQLISTTDFNNCVKFFQKPLSTYMYLVIMNFYKKKTKKKNTDSILKLFIKIEGLLTSIYTSFVQKKPQRNIPISRI